MNDNALILAAASLSGAAPREWAKFIEELKAYADRRRDDMVRSGPEGIHVAQGRAQNAVQVAEMLRDCRVNAEKIATQVQSKLGGRK